MRQEGHPATALPGAGPDATRNLWLVLLTPGVARENHASHALSSKPASPNTLE